MERLTSSTPTKPRAGRFFRGKSPKSVGGLVSRIFKTLTTLAHFGAEDARGGAEDDDDDDGGFGDPGALGAKTPADAQVAAGTRDAPGAQAVAPRGETPLRRYGGRIPGALGLKNHGNTCFMNAAVQCLSNTDLLAEFLGLRGYALRGAQTGGNGEVTERLASLVRALWTLDYTPQLSVDFKAVVSKYGSQFHGNSQHDALEFLLWLLDRVHEDISPALCRNGNMIQAPQQGPVGSEELLSSDPSQSQQPAGVQPTFVQQHFQAQYKSSLTCPHCLKQSNTFDPFLCISLPIPLRQTRFKILRFPAAEGRGIKKSVSLRG